MKWINSLIVSCSFALPIHVIAANLNYLESTDLSVGVSHICATTSAGVKCFGNAESVTLKAPAMTAPTLLNTGNRFSCALIKEGIKCWGEIPGQKKTEILIGPSTVKAPKLLSVGYEHACAVSAADQIKCWGKNDFKEGTPPTGLKNVTELSLGMNNSCAIADGKVVCWGANFAGSTTVPETLVNPHNLTSGWWHHCVQSDEGIKCWGYPYKDFVTPDDPSITTIASGGLSNCGVTPDGVKCWDETGKTRLVEESVGVTQLKVGTDTGCGLSPDKGMFCFKLTNETGPIKLLKSFVPAGGLQNIEMVAAGNASTCIYGDDDTLKCWGFNPDGALDVPATLPGPISALSLGSHKLCALNGTTLNCYGDVRKTYDMPKNLGEVTMMSSGGYHVCAGNVNKVSCWGDDVRDALVVPKNLTNVSSISSGFTHACVVSNNQVTCWGGTGLIKGVNPAKAMVNPKAICAGGTFSCAIDNAGKVTCWGKKIPLAGETFADAEKANQVLNVPEEINNAIEISCGMSQACAIYDNKVKCWGSGDALTSNKITIKNPHGLSAGWSHTCALGDNGLNCWGDMLNMAMPNYALEK